LGEYPFKAIPHVIAQGFKGLMSHINELLLMYFYAIYILIFELGIPVPISWHYYDFHRLICVADITIDSCFAMF